jgi:hypothetical protein
MPGVIDQGVDLFVVLDDLADEGVHLLRWSPPGTVTNRHPATARQ